MTDENPIDIDTDADGMTIELDADSDLGKRVARLAGHNAEDPAEFLEAAVREKLDEEDDN